MMMHHPEPSSHARLLATLGRLIKPAVREQAQAAPTLAIETVRSKAWRSITFEGFHHEIVLVRDAGTGCCPPSPCMSDLVSADRLSGPHLSMAECRLVALSAVRGNDGRWRDRMTFQALSICM